MMARPDPTEQGARRWGRRALRVLVGLVLFVCAAIAVAAGYIAVQLAYGPLEVAPAARVAERVVSEAVGGGRRTSVRTAHLTLDFENGLAIRLGDVSVGGPESGLSLSIPQASIGLRILPLALGDIRPSSLDLRSPKILVDLPTLDRFHADRDLGRPSEPAGAPVPQPLTPPARAPLDEKAALVGPVAVPVGADLLRSRLETLAHAVERNLGFIRAEGLETLSASGGEIVVVRNDDQGRPVRVTVPDVEISADFDRTDVDFDLGFSASGEVGRWSMRLRQTSEGGGARRRLVFNASDVTMRDLFGPSRPDFKAEMPLYPEVAVEVDRAGQLAAARLDLRLGAGVLRFGHAPEDEYLVDEGMVSLGWDVAAGRFAIDRAGVTVGPSAVYVKGGLLPPKPGQGGDWAWELTLDKARIAPRDVPGAPLDVQAFTAAGAYDVARRALKLDDLQVHFTGGAMRAVGHLDLLPATPIFAVNLVFTPVEADVVKKAWPHFIAPGARNWFVHHVHGGVVSDALIKLQIPLFVEPALLPGNAASVTARFDKLDMTTFGDLPRIQDGAGTLSLQNHKFEVVADRGQAATRHPRRPSFSSFRLEIADTRPKVPRGFMEMRLSGDNVALGQIIDAEPLGLLATSGVKLEGLAGTGDVRGRIDMNFGPDVGLDSIDYRFEALLSGFGSPSPILGRRFQDANLKVLVDQRGTTITGKARIDGLPTDVNMFEPKDGSKAVERRDFGMVLDDAARTKLGIDLAGLVSGPIKVDIGHAANNDQIRKVVADLTQARLVIPQFGWTKGAGVQARSTLDVSEDDKGGTRIDNFVMESEGLSVRGSLTLDKDKKLASADLGRFSLRKGDDAKLRMQRGQDQVLNVNFEAGSFDLRSLLKSIKQQSDVPEVDPKKQSDMNVKVRAARLIGFNDVTLTDVVIDAQVRAQVVTRLQLTGRAQGGRSVEITIRPDGARRVVTMTSDDAGAVLGFLDIYERMRGGSLQLAAALTGPGTASGVIRTVNFGLVPPRNERAAQPRTTNDGLREVAVRDVPITEEAAFDKFEVKFAMRRGVITLTDGIAKGPATGATMSGQIDLNSQRLNAAGTFIPLYGLNNLVSRIPLFGDIVGAGRNEGLVGVTFKVGGSVEDPVLQFNPVSAIAPGIFRKIFEYRVDGQTQAPQPPVRQN